MRNLDTVNAGCEALAHNVFHVDYDGLWGSKNMGVLARAATILVAVAAISTAAPALSFADGDISATCLAPPNGAHCIFWSQSYTGAHVQATNISDFNRYFYPNNGTGAGQRIGNNNGSDQNRSRSACLALYYEPNSVGIRLNLAKYGSGGVWQRKGAELGKLLNNIRSDFFYAC